MKKIIIHLIAVLMIFSLALMPIAACAQGPDPGEQGNNPPSANPDPEKDPEKEPEKEPEETHEYLFGFERKEYVLSEVSPADTGTLSAVLTCDGTPLETAVTYEIADGSVAAVEGNTVTAAAAGETVLRAKCEYGGKAYEAEASLYVYGTATAEEVNSFDEQFVNLFGRTYFSASKLTLDNVCTGVEVAFQGTSLSVSLLTTGSKIRVFIDGDSEGEEHVLKSSTKPKEIVLAEGLENGIHTARILKAASAGVENSGKITFAAKDAFATEGLFLAAREKSELKIEIIGDSITAGAGALGTSPSEGETIENSDPTKAYSYLTVQALGADFSIMAREGMCVKDSSPNAYDIYRLRATSGSATEYDPAQFDADIVIVGLGENDMWHATSSSFPYTVDQFQKDYADMLRLIREAHPAARIVCVYGMMPASSTVAAQSVIRQAIKDTADPNITDLKLQCNELGANKHPNAAAHRSNADLLIKHIQDLFKEETA